VPNVLKTLVIGQLIWLLQKKKKKKKYEHTHEFINVNHATLHKMY
jgi:hypothetical protein